MNAPPTLRSSGTSAAASDSEIFYMPQGATLEATFLEIATLQRNLSNLSTWSNAHSRTRTEARTHTHTHTHTHAHVARAHRHARTHARTHAPTPPPTRMHAWAALKAHRMLAPHRTARFRFQRTASYCGGPACPCRRKTVGTSARPSRTTAVRIVRLYALSCRSAV